MWAQLTRNMPSCYDKYVYMPFSGYESLLILKRVGKRLILVKRTDTVSAHYTVFTVHFGDIWIRTNLL